MIRYEGSLHSSTQTSFLPSTLLTAVPADPTSLESLFDLATPPPVPWWPPAPGWFVAAGVGLVLLLWIASRTWKHWQAAAYRRAALSEWQRLKAQARDRAHREAALQHFPELVIRTALAAFPREQVASLSGTAWLRFLDRTGHTDAFTRGRGRILPILAYDPQAVAQLDSVSVEELFIVVRRWIRHHSTAVQTAIPVATSAPIPSPTARVDQGWDRSPPH